jgi:hypothetical protein
MARELSNFILGFDGFFFGGAGRLRRRRAQPVGELSHATRARSGPAPISPILSTKFKS